MSATRPGTMKLALGPLLYYWPRETVLAFYRDCARWPVDTVYLGETVCSRRRELKLADWISIGEDLARAGKEVVLSTSELIESDADLRTMHSVADNGTFRVEANDMAAVRALAGKGPFVAGPFLNVYNAGTLALLAELGATRWVAPVELSREGIAAVGAEAPAGMETEIFAYGRLPLAVRRAASRRATTTSPRTTASSAASSTPTGSPSTRRMASTSSCLNGVQTQSACVQSLVAERGRRARPARTCCACRRSRKRMGEVVAVFREARDGALAPREAAARLAPLMPAAPRRLLAWQGPHTQPRTWRSPHEVLDPVRKLPAPVGAIGRRLPRLPASIAFAHGVEPHAAAQVPGRRLDRLEATPSGSWSRTRAMELRFRVRNRRFRAGGAPRPSPCCASAPWPGTTPRSRARGRPRHALLQPPPRVEGDTEIALLGKNTLDTIDIPRTRGLLKRAMRVAGPARG